MNESLVYFCCGVHNRDDCTLPLALVRTWSESVAVSIISTWCHLNPIWILITFAFELSAMDAPPSYIANVPQDGPPPSYTFPTTFKIGSATTYQPFVTPQQLKGHLRLLQLFYNLRETVEAGKDDRLPAWAKQLEPERRWAWFIALATVRWGN
jgi:hypothetical protein